MPVLLERQRQRVRAAIELALKGLMKAIAATSNCRGCYQATVSADYWRRLVGALSSLADRALAPVLEELLGNVYQQGSYGETRQCRTEFKTPALLESAQKGCLEDLAQAKDLVLGLWLACVRSGTLGSPLDQHHVH